jgi:UDP-2,3-diacylglucosamine hydrolase
MQRPAYIASDIHLGAVPDSTERAFVRFLEHVGCEASSLLLPGDVFDFWFEYGPIIHGRHFRTLAALSALVDAGIPVAMTGGNHDAWGGRFLREQVGITLHDGPFHTTLGGRTALVAHGDGLGVGDLKYRALRAVLRSRITIAAFRVLHPELGLRIARAVSSTEGKAGGEEEARALGRARFLEDWARARLKEDASLAWVVCGHAHVPAVVEVEPSRWYLNAGDWIRHLTYITISSAGRPALHHWSANT